MKIKLRDVDKNIRKNSIINSILPYLIFNICLILFFNNRFIYSYYIIPFKYNRDSLSDLYQIHSNLTKEKIFLNYTMELSLLTYLKINSSIQFKGYISSRSVCTTYDYGKSEYNFDFNILNEHNNINISNIVNKIVDNNRINLDGKEIYLLIGFGISQFNLTSDCISFVDEIKKNDNTVKSYVWSIKYYDLNNKNNYDGELIIGIEPHDYQPNVFDKSKYLTINNYIDEDSIYFPTFEKNQYGIQFNSVYFYNNNDNSFENIIKCHEQNSMEGFFDMKIGMIQCTHEYYELINKNFFKKYLNSHSCKEIIFTRNSYTIVCEKKELNIEEFYKNFPTLYFKNVDSNYIFEFTAKDLFKEENDKLYFMIFSQASDYKWVFGEIFLKKYYFTFNPDKKLIGFYDNINNKKNNDEKKDYGKTGLIILIIGIILIIINAIIFGLYFWKKKYGKERRKRANELNDDNYDYVTDNSDKNKILNED